MAVVEHRGRVMGSELHVILCGAGPEHIDHAVRRLEHLERCWSRFLPESDISRLNRAAGTALVVDPSTITLVEHMVDGWIRSAGRFDPTLLPELLDLGYVASVDDDSRMTERPAHGRAAPWSLLDIEVDAAEGLVRLPVGLSLDPGGIGKGLAADLVVDQLLSGVVEGALVDIGGDLRAGGRAPGPDGWLVRVEDPHRPALDLAVLVLDDGGVCTSSTLSRRWKRDGMERHHLVDPVTRQVADTDLAAVTVVAATAATAEVLATSALLAGRDRALAELDDGHVPALLTTATGVTSTTSAVPEPAASPSPGAVA